MQPPQSFRKERRPRVFEWFGLICLSKSSHNPGILYVLPHHKIQPRPLAQIPYMEHQDSWTHDPLGNFTRGLSPKLPQMALV